MYRIVKQYGKYYIEIEAKVEYSLFRKPKKKWWPVDVNGFACQPLGVVGELPPFRNFDHAVDEIERFKEQRKGSNDDKEYFYEPFNRPTSSPSKEGKQKSTFYSKTSKGRENPPPPPPANR